MSDAIPEPFWDAVRSHPRRLLMLDYDGTLVPFQERRDLAFLAPETLELLSEIRAATRLVVISGRPAADLERFLPLPILRIGEHGWDELSASGRRKSHPLPAEATAALWVAYQTAIAEGWDDHVERKRCSLVLHTRGVPSDQAAGLEARCVRAWGSESSDGPVHLTRIAGGRELRANGRDKGVAAGALMAEMPDALSVYVGDDLTDEDAFEVVELRGYGIHVASSAGADTSAKFRLASPDEVHQFLRRWCEVASGRITAGDRARDR